MNPQPTYSPFFFICSNMSRNRETARRNRQKKLASTSYTPSTVIPEQKTSWFPKVQPATLSMYENQLETWYEYVQLILRIFAGGAITKPVSRFYEEWTKHHNNTSVPHSISLPLSPGDPLPEMYLIKEWIRWISQAATGRIQEVITRNTMFTYWNRLREGLQRKTHRTFDKADVKQINGVRSIV